MNIPRFHIYRQLESSDCGIACIRMIARNYGKKIPIKTLKNLTEINRSGVSLEDISITFHKIGIESRSLFLTFNDILKMPLPAIVHWKQNHFVVLYYIDKINNIFYIADPAEGKIKLSKEEFCRYWKNESELGAVMVAEPGDFFYHQNYSDTNTFKLLCKKVFHQIKSCKTEFTRIVVLSILCLLADLLMPLMLQMTVDKGIEQNDVAVIWLLVLGQLFVFLGYFVTSSFTQFILAKTGMFISFSMIRSYIVKLLNMPLFFFESRTAADLIQKIEDQHRIKDFLLQLPNSLIFIIFNIVVFSCLMIWYNYWLFAIFLFLTVLEIGWTFIFVNERRGLDYAYFSTIAENRNYVYEIINGLKEIKACGAQESRLNKWEINQFRQIGLSLKDSILSIKINGGQSIISRFKEILITGICATFVVRGYLTMGEMLTVCYLTGRLSGPFHGVVDMIVRIQNTLISYERLDDVLGWEEEIGTEIIGPLKYIEFKNVGFRYSGSCSPFVIDDLTIRVEAGKTTAIVGASGCGKTTLIKLMLGFYKPQKGEINFNGIDCSELDIAKWIKQCGVVMQDGFIFSDTISGNIAMSETDINIERVKEVTKIVGLDVFIDSLPMKYDTLIGASGMDLSGGQKQRILIARSLYLKPDVLFLDEATSSLDSNNERSITDNIIKMQNGKTLIVSAHRLSTVKNADRIIYLENGNVVEDGTHEQLLNLKGKYYSLVKNQLEY